MFFFLSRIYLICKQRIRRKISFSFALIKRNKNLGCYIFLTLIFGEKPKSCKLVHEIFLINNVSRKLVHFESLRISELLRHYKILNGF